MRQEDPTDTYCFAGSATHQHHLPAKVTACAGGDGIYHRRGALHSNAAAIARGLEQGSMPDKACAGWLDRL